jgi:heat shock protein HtpX
VYWFSRRREFRADSGGARLAGADKMIGALERLKRGTGGEPLPQALSAFGISNAGKRQIAALFSTHPSLDDRIAALRANAGL